MAENTPESLRIVYDGECPFCSEYLKVLRLRDAAKTVELISARDPHPLVDEVLKLGFDLDEGMVAKVGDAYYHGADCVHILSLMSTPSGVFNKLNNLIFKHRFLATLLYPVLRFGRNMTLRLLGHQKLADS